MCRLTAYTGPAIRADDLVMRPNRSVITQAFAARERITSRGYLNGDGFGLGWYGSGTADEAAAHAREVTTVEPCVFTSTGPAWNNQNLARLAKTIWSPVIFAHVRAATEGTQVCECCCHPFQAGRFLFMHNGNIGGYAKVRKTLMTGLGEYAFNFAVTKGSSDSALCFALFLDQLADVTVALSPAEMFDKLSRVIFKLDEVGAAAGITEPNLLNFVLTDGITLVATRYVRQIPDRPAHLAASLYFSSGTRYEQSATQADGVYHMKHADVRDTLCIVTSEPLTDDSCDWVPVPVNYALVVTSQINVVLAPISAAASRTSPAHISLANLPTVSKASIIQKPTISPRSLIRNPAFIDAQAAHNFSQHTDSILALAFCNGFLFSGSLDSTIRVWDVATLQNIAVLTRHTKGVTALSAYEDKFVFSSSSDCTVVQWCAKTLAPLAQIPFSSMGHPLSLFAVKDHIIIGFQDTLLRSVSFSLLGDACFHVPPKPATDPSPSACFSPDAVRRPVSPEIACPWSPVQLTDSTLPGEVVGCGSSSHAHRPVTACVQAQAGPRGALLTYGDWQRSFHCSYVFAMTTTQFGYLCSGAGDSLVNVWDLQSGAHVKMFTGHTNSVTALAASLDGHLVFSASRDHTIKVWDMESLGCKYTLNRHTDEVLALAIDSNLLYSGAADGSVFAWGVERLEFLYHVCTSSSAIEAVLILPGTDQICTGSSGKLVQLWATRPVDEVLARPKRASAAKYSATNLVETLKTFVSFKSVSGAADCLHDSANCARYLHKWMAENLQAEVVRISCGDSKNPVVCARIVVDPAAPTVTIYGHYDVHPAHHELWKTDPWVLTAVDGYLYGRGSTDDKGPIVATLFAVKDLLETHQLKVNLCFIYEGEEESQSAGFQEAVRSKLSWLRETDAIVVSNNYWVDEERPCVTYAMRGVLALSVNITGPKGNLHSGVDGGAVVEPMMDLVSVLATTMDAAGHVLVPGFYDNVALVGPEEGAKLDEVDLDIAKYKESLGVTGLLNDGSNAVLRARWCLPSFSIASVTSSNSTESHSLIPCRASAILSIRFVPMQTAAEVAARVEEHLQTVFRARKSPNKLSVAVQRSGDWWLGDPSNTLFKAANAAINTVWGRDPVHVREGGTMRLTSFLTAELNAPAIHIPLGQASDNAHLANERISARNLINGMNVIKQFLLNFGEMHASAALPAATPGVAKVQFSTPIEPQAL